MHLKKERKIIRIEIIFFTILIISMWKMYRIISYKYFNFTSMSLKRTINVAINILSLQFRSKKNHRAWFFTTKWFSSLEEKVFFFFHGLSDLSQFRKVRKRQKLDWNLTKTQQRTCFYDNPSIRLLFTFANINNVQRGISSMNGLFGSFTHIHSHSTQIAVTLPLDFAVKLSLSSLSPISLSLYLFSFFLVSFFSCM